MKNLMMALMMTVLAGGLYANDGYYEASQVLGEVRLGNSDSVQMLEEEVAYRDGRFTTVFRFKNQSAQDEKVTFGFPIDGNYDIATPGFSDEELYEMDQWTEDMIYSDRLDKAYNLEFETFINGQRVERDIQILPLKEDYDFVFLTEVQFDAKEVKIISNSYVQEPSYSGSVMGDDKHQIEYIFETGASWKDNIESALMTFYIPRPVYGETKEVLINGSLVEKDLGDMAGKPKLLETDKYYPFLYKNIYNISNYADQATVEELEDEYKISWDFTEIIPDKNLILSWEKAMMYEYQIDDEMNDALQSAIYDQESDAFFEEYPELEAIFNDRAQFRSFLLAVLSYPDIYGYDRISGRFIINAFSALRGYLFSTVEWMNFFSGLDWYEPTTRSPEYSEFELAVFTEIRDTDAYQEEMEIECNTIPLFGN